MRLTLSASASRDVYVLLCAYYNHLSLLQQQLQLAIRDHQSDVEIVSPLVPIH